MKHQLAVLLKLLEYESSSRSNVKILGAKILGAINYMIIHH